MGESHDREEGEVVTVLNPHTAMDDDELTLNVNDEVTVIEKDDSGWWRGRLGDKEGLFPSGCLQKRYKEDKSLVSMLKETWHFTDIYI